MINIFKASAGSGKTHTLSKTYLDLLLKADSKTAYRNILAVTFTNKATEEMKERILRDLAEEGKTNPRAREILINLLHDYGSFSVSTIDKFFQQALRAFSRELGSSGNYQIELDKTSLTKEAMDRVLDDLTEKDKDLLGWFTKQLETALDNGESFHLESSLYEMAEEFGDVNEKFTYDKKKLTELKEKCKEIVDTFHKDVYENALCIDTTTWGKTAAKGLAQYAGAQTKYKDSVKAANATTLAKLAETAGCEAMYALMNPQGRRWKEYRTARMVEKVIFTLGLAEEFYSKLAIIEEEKGVISLDESTSLLRDIIDGSDAPFIYEKLGVRFNHFLLDEFQDTSVVQWENFKPLLANSVSEGYSNIIVGDVKQSIYRWRNSDWNLLDKEIEENFKGKVEVITLKENWRSTQSIVNFNNEFFTFAADNLGLSTIYADVKQEAKVEDSQEGCVTVDFCEDELEMIDGYIEQAVAAGAKMSDMAILLRTNGEGKKVAEYLLSKGYSVISDDSLDLKSSLIIRKIVSYLHSLCNNSDSLNTYLSESLEIDSEREYHSLLDLVDGVIKDLSETHPDEIKGQTLFIQSFMDDILEWTSIHGNDLRQYLKHWEESKIAISSPNDPNAIRITTVHKSKGLAFPIVIFPFAEKVGLFKEDTLWCHLDSDAEMGESFNSIFPVVLGKSSGDSFFSESLKNEMEMQRIDNLNIFYVCLTRARKEMHIIAKNPPKSLIDGKSSPNDLSQLLYLYCEQNGYTFGSPYRWNEASKKEDSEIEEFDAEYETYGMNPEACSRRFVASSDAWDYFSEEGIGQSKRLRGIEQHALLSRIRTSDDAPEVLRSIEPQTRELLLERISAHSEWFSPELKTLNEVAIIDSFGNTNRPDRVLVDEEGHVTVIDFKFGEEDEKYSGQVRRYMRLFREMGYGEVSGYIWYVPTDKIIQVSEGLL
ncbi:MAG: UvrD-helicase domain-containing protein [Candidatus Cryptobacteroides sp.]|nr:UvrD-helicase domain-containing protein [Candidatus Cryptobacteroides sp.]